MTADTGRDDTGVRVSGDDDDDEALSWGPASDDKSYVEGPVVDRPVGWELDSVDDDDDDDGEDEDDLPAGVMSSGMLVAHGVAAAVFLLFAVAWLKSIAQVAPSFDSALADWMWRIGTWFAVGSPIIWFLGTVLLVPTSASRRRLLLFVVGIVVLLPWPFLIGNFS